MCRITVNGKVAQFSCKLDVEEKLWNVELGRMGGRSITTSVCLSNGVPIETLSKIMGHTSIKTSQIYAKITEDKINHEMSLLSKRISIVEDNICKSI